MKNLRQVLFTIAMVVGLAFSVSAQSDDQKRPPKQNPPKIEPRPKDGPPRGNPPKEQDRPKKPGMSAYLIYTQNENKLA